MKTGRKSLCKETQKATLYELNSKLTVLETHIKNENMIHITEMQKRSQIEQKNTSVRKRLVFNNITVHHIYCNNNIFFSSKR